MNELRLQSNEKNPDDRKLYNLEKYLRKCIATTYTKKIHLHFFLSMGIVFILISSLKIVGSITRSQEMHENFCKDPKI